MTGHHDHTHSDHSHDHGDAERWKHDGVRVIPGNQLDPNVPSTAGMDRKAAINFARVGAQKLWAGTVTIRPDAVDPDEVLRVADAARLRTDGAWAVWRSKSCLLRAVKR